MSSLADRIEGEKSHPLAWKAVVKRAALIAVAGLAIYLVFLLSPRYSRPGRACQR
jgi:hypothetical protein